MQKYIRIGSSECCRSDGRWKFEHNKNIRETIRSVKGKLLFLPLREVLDYKGVGGLPWFLTSTQIINGCDEYKQLFGALNVKGE